MLIVDKLGDEEGTLMQIDEGGTDESLCLCDLKVDSEQGIIDLTVLVLVVIIHFSLGYLWLSFTDVIPILLSF